MKGVEKSMYKFLSKKLKRFLPTVPNKTLENVEFDQKYWDTLYEAGRWNFLHDVSELAHYSVLVGYCHFFSPNGSYLEIGCGEGILQQRLKVLNYNSYTGVDVSQIAINIATKFSDERTKFTSCDALRFNDSNFYDVIIFNESLYCFNDCLAVLKHFSKMLAKNGLFIISMHVQSVSNAHWREIDEEYSVIDSITIENLKKTQWKCKAVAVK
ncbi:MAG: class I SAM-dependent methyltransferase [Desulfobulbaceae bacterium]|nr:MAG: class I SAM-dependent methyltransferase [Desulfobulbaceae bacterium]